MGKEPVIMIVDQQLFFIKAVFVFKQSKFLISIKQKLSNQLQNAGSC